MKNIIATWICLDTPGDDSYFPSAKGKSSDKKVQDIYWRCICSFFVTARRMNPDACLLLFSNALTHQEVSGVPVQQVLDRLQVTTHFVEQYKTPLGYYQQWRNQFYEFSILEHITRNSFFDPADRFLLLDSDCIINKNLDALFNDITTYGCITYQIEYQLTHVINGLSRKDMRTIYSELLHRDIGEFPAYHGGELYASTIKTAAIIIKDFYSVWEKLIERYDNRLSRLNEEAHVLSFLFYKNNYTGGQANEYIKRLWTDPATFRNVDPADKYLSIFHLPAEKRKGFVQFFDYLKRRDFNLDGTDAQTIDRTVQRIFKVPAIPVHSRPYYMGKRIFKKLFETK
jgi:hypothetical protein